MINVKLNLNINEVKIECIGCLGTAHFFVIVVLFGLQSSSCHLNLKGNPYPTN